MPCDSQNASTENACGGNFVCIATNSSACADVRNNADSAVANPKGLRRFLALAGSHLRHVVVRAAAAFRDATVGPIGVVLEVLEDDVFATVALLGSLARGRLSCAGAFRGKGALFSEPRQIAMGEHNRLLGDRGLPRQ